MTNELWHRNAINGLNRILPLPPPLQVGVIGDPHLRVSCFYLGVFNRIEVLARTGCK